MLTWVKVGAYRRATYLDQGAPHLAMKGKSPFPGSRLRAPRLAFAAAAVAAACVPEPLDDEDHSRVALTVLGDPNITLQSGDRYELSVRYHDEDGYPLVGIVDFKFLGDPLGSSLSTPAATTDSTGTARVTLDTFGAEEGSFGVMASAIGGATVTWDVTITSPAEPLSPTGVYRIESRLNVGGDNLRDGALRDALASVEELAADPGAALLSQAAYLGFITEVEAADGGAALTGFVEGEAPEGMARLRAFGRGIDELSRALGLEGTLFIESEHGRFEAEHALSRVVIALGDERHPLSLGELGAQQASPQRLDVDVSEGERTLTLAAHALPIPFATVLERAIDDYVLPSIDDGARDVMNFLHESIDCLAVADWLDLEYDLGPIVADLACRDSVTAIADEIAQRLDALDDEALELIISGQARVVEHDGEVEALRDGVWEGALEHSGATQAIFGAGTSEFSASRLDD